jgi:tRNA(Ile)-lysidine synthase
MESIAEIENFTYTATAHHLDDEVETFLLNLMRGTGIAGLHGILPKSGQVIHPMLFTGRQDISNYARERRIEFREDTSNKKTDYGRNKIRHLVIPELEKIKPGFRKILSKDIDHIRSVERIYRAHLSETWTKVAKTDKNSIRISIQELRKLPELSTYLYEFLQPYGFNASDSQQIVTALDGQAGKQFVSETHRIVLDREFLLIAINKANEPSETEFLIPIGTKKIEQPVRLTLEVYPRSESFGILKEPRVAQLDADKVDFPLIIRRWQKGDRFYPLGMKGKKLLSDYFTDQKLSLFQKETTWIMTSKDDIVWIIGRRIDNRFKVTGSTRIILDIRVDI